jgi:hypothetical protein
MREGEFVPAPLFLAANDNREDGEPVLFLIDLKTVGGVIVFCLHDPRAG